MFSAPCSTYGAKWPRPTTLAHHVHCLWKMRLYRPPARQCPLPQWPRRRPNQPNTERAWPRNNCCHNNSTKPPLLSLIAPARNGKDYLLISLHHTSISLSLLYILYIILFLSLVMCHLLYILYITYFFFFKFIKFLNYCNVGFYFDNVAHFVFCLNLSFLPVMLRPHTRPVLAHRVFGIIEWSSLLWLFF